MSTFFFFFKVVPERNLVVASFGSNNARAACPHSVKNGTASRTQM